MTSKAIPEDILQEVDRLRESLQTCIEMSEGTAWVGYISVLAATGGEIQQMLERAGEVDRGARLPVRQESIDHQVSNFVVPDTPEEVGDDHPA